MPTAVDPTVITLASCPVTYQILYHNPPTLDGDPSGWRSTMCFTTSERDSGRFCQWAGGLPYLIDLGGGSTVTRYIPLSDPKNPKLICMSIRCKLTGSYTPDEDEPYYRQWSDAKIELGFSSVPYITDGSVPFSTQETDMGVEVYSIAGANYVFPGGERIHADAGRKVPTQVYVYTVYNALALADSTVNPLLGKLNASPFLGNPAGTVRCDGRAERIQTLASFQKAWTRTLKLTYRPIEWNKFLKRDATWDTPLDPGGNPAYEYADFSPLLA
jgi:hypothetical protein